MASRNFTDAGQRLDGKVEPNGVFCVDALVGLKALANESVDCVMTSPPYWALRDYGLKPVIWGGDPDCQHGFSTLRTSRPSGSGGDTPLQSTNQGSYVTDSKDRAIYSSVCERCGAWRGVLGLEPEIPAYIEHLCMIFDEVHRVLKPTGTLWVNLGDTYHNATKWSAKDETPQTIAGGNNRDYRASRRLDQGLPEKCLSLIPARFALAMIERGWTLRNDVVWHKPNHMPCSVKDRFAPTWEHLFFFVKSARYFFDLDAVREPHKSLEQAEKRRRSQVSGRPSPHIGGVRLPPHPGEPGSMHPLGKNPGDFWTITAETRSLGAIVGFNGAVKVPGGAGWIGHPPGGEARILREMDSRWLTPEGKNPGDTWEINTRAFPGAHFAVYPEQLCEKPIKAGCPERVCKRCGTPRFRGSRTGQPKTVDLGPGPTPRAHRRRSGPQFSCRCRKGFLPGVVLDPFVGAGTTAVVATRLGRQFLGFDANGEYVRMAQERLARMPCTSRR